MQDHTKPGEPVYRTDVTLICTDSRWLCAVQSIEASKMLGAHQDIAAAMIAGTLVVGIMHDVTVRDSAPNGCYTVTLMQDAA
jgi:hypothetical protein